MTVAAIRGGVGRRGLPAVLARHPVLTVRWTASAWAHPPPGPVAETTRVQYPGLGLVPPRATGRSRGGRGPEGSLRPVEPRLGRSSRRPEPSARLRRPSCPAWLPRPGATDTSAPLQSPGRRPSLRKRKKRHPHAPGAFKSLVEMRGFEPLTPAMRTRCSPTELHPRVVPSSGIRRLDFSGPTTSCQRHRGAAALRQTISAAGSLTGTRNRAASAGGGGLESESRNASA